MQDTKKTDILVIGGGINGAGIARDAAGRGLSVTLCEMNDFAAATSSASSKLIHGGLRYLEHYEFNLVRKALIEREVLMALAPHIIWPLRFVLPHHKALRPAFLLRIGLFLYDHMGGRKLLPPTRKLNLHQTPQGAPLDDTFRLGFEYSDCWVDDARLTLLNVRDAADKGADILKGWRCTGAVRKDGLWHATLETADGTQQAVEAKAIVNASGSWAADIANKVDDTAGRKHALRLVKGSHIVVPRLYDGDHAYTFQEADGRIIFAIPYEQDFTLVGTTDVVFDGNPAEVSISSDETDYLCGAVGRYLKKKITPDQVVSHFSGIRPLVDDGEENASQVTRDYRLALSDQKGQAPLLSVFGGKVTTYRKLAEDAFDKLTPWFPNSRGNWTDTALLPGGDLDGLSHEAWTDRMQASYPWADPAMLARFTRQYGSLTPQILDGIPGTNGLGTHFGADLYEAELIYLRDKEWATSAEDALWRRTKLGLRLTKDQQDAVARWFRES